MIANLIAGILCLIFAAIAFVARGSAVGTIALSVVGVANIAAYFHDRRKRQS